MNKSQLINLLSDATGFTKSDTQIFLGAFMEVVSKSLSKGKSVGLVGFGTFSKVKRKARKGRNPQTGASIRIPARNVPTFKPGKILKDLVN